MGRKERLVDWRIALPGEQTHRYQAFGVESTGAKVTPIIALHMNQRTGGQRFGGGIHPHFVGEYPGRSGAGTAPLTGFELNDRALAHEKSNMAVGA
jgi:hypothetical protein